MCSVFVGSHSSRQNGHKWTDRPSVGGRLHCTLFLCLGNFWALGSGFGSPKPFSCQAPLFQIKEALERFFPEILSGKFAPLSLSSPKPRSVDLQCT